MSSEARRIVDEAKGRYLFDAEFHAKVETTVRIMQATHDLDPENDDHGLITMAAAVALALPPVSHNAPSAVVQNAVHMDGYGTRDEPR